MTSTFANDVFGTLSKQYCIYFYILCVCSFIACILALFGFFVLFTQKNTPTATYLTTFAIVINYFLFYISHRLYYSMCINSLK